MPLSPGDKLGPYEILAPIGAGGMGEVYRAHDARLDRDVAIKVLPGHLADDSAALARFEREARAVAALSHPNILVLFDIGSRDGVTWVVTELLEGETLRARLDRGAMPWRKAAELGAAIAEGLAAAHARGITHRDIKPANIFLTSDGRVKILDFGLASKTPILKPDDKTASDVLPEYGTVSGTVGYMSPEQLRGEAAGPATDIFSLGCVLYEMVTGRRPFAGQSTTETIAAVLKEEPAAITDSGKPTSPELERVIDRCLAKNPAQRFHSAHDLAFALRSLSSSAGEHQAAAPQPRFARRAAAASIIAVVLILAGAAFYYWRGRAGQSIDSLAILPFVNMSGSPDADYLSDGITESLIDGLSELPNLKVMARNAVFRYKGKEADPHGVGRELGVRAVLTGRVTQHGDNLVVSAELVNVDDNRQLWGQQYNRKAADALAVQNDIAHQISAKLRSKLASEQMDHMARRQTGNPEAYQFYLKGRYYIQKFDLEDMNKGLGYFQQAIALDPNYALAYDGIAYYYLLGDDLFLPVAESMPKARQAARKALDIDESIAESHVEMGQVDFAYDFDWPAAERDLKRAIELDPNYAPGHEYYGWYLTIAGNANEAIAEGRRAEALDPVTPEICAATGWSLYFARRYDEAVTQLNKCVDLDPNYWFSRWVLGQAYAQQGRFPDALAAEAKVLQIDPGLNWATAESARAYALSGKRADAQQTLDGLLALSEHGHVSKYPIAAVYAALGQKGQTLDALERAWAERSFFLIFLRTDPEFDSLRSEPRFQELVHRMNFPP